MIDASSCSAKQRSSSALGESLTPRISTPWLRTSRTPASSIARAAFATSGVTDWALLTWVWMASDTPRERALAHDAGHALDDVVLQPVLGQAHQRLGGEPDVADVVDLEQLVEEPLEVLPRHVGHVAAGDDDVAHLGGAVQVVEHRGVAVDRLAGQLELGELRRRVADEVHPRAVAAVLRARRQHLGEHLGGVAVGEPLDGPHVVLVQAVARRERVARPVGAAVGEDREHVVAHRVGVEGLGERGAGRGHVAVGARDHRVHHLRRHEHRHRRPLGLVALEVGVEAVLEQVAHQRAQLRDVLHAVRPLPLGVGPLLGGDVTPPRESGPVGLNQLTTPVGVGLVDVRRHNWQDTQ